MKNYIDIVNRSELFKGIEEDDINKLLKCLTERKTTYLKNEIIYSVGDTITNVALVLDGCVHILKEDYWGNKTILSNIERGQLFGESYACLQREELTISAVAYKPTTALFMSVSKILSPCQTSCTFHLILIQNFLKILAEKNLKLTRKMEHMAGRNTKEKLISYLSEQSKKANSPEFTIPFNRQQLADYLCIDRSAMSKELCKLRDSGILQFNKNNFKLIG